MCLFSSRVLLATGLAAILAPACLRAAVVINELMASASDRIVVQEPGQVPHVGVTTPWQSREFADALWSQGAGPFGFGTLGGVTAATDTSAAMQGRVPSLYLRQAFTVTSAQAASASTLRLQIRCNDGFVAYLNGVEIARRNLGPAGTFVAHDQAAFNPDRAATALTLNLGAANSRLTTGVNVLCIQAHNILGSSGDAETFLCQAALEIATSPVTTLVPVGATWRYFVGVTEPSGGVVDHGLLRLQPDRVLWASPEFNDLSWPSGPGPVGFDAGNPVDYPLGTSLRNALYQRATSLYTRAVFAASAAEASSPDPLVLALDYDDGVVVYLNGREIARRNVGTAGTVTPHTATALADHPANGDGGVSSGRDETLTLGSAASLLVEGDNILAVQVHNVSLTSTDLIARVTLQTSGASARTLVSPTGRVRYLVGDHSPHGEDNGANELPDPVLDANADWIELHNTGASAVDLTGWSMTDDAARPRKWLFPSGTTIAADGYLVVLATELGLGPADGTSYLHAGFKLSSGGEYLGLVDSTGTIADALDPTYPPQTARASYGRDGSGQFVYLAHATPGAANHLSGGSSTLVAGPVVTPAGGYHTGPVVVTVSAEPGASIRYTLDGTAPSATRGSLYGSALSITSSTPLRTIAIRGDGTVSPITTQTYLVDQSAARRSLPVYCMTGDAGTVFYGPNSSGGPANGIGVLAIKGGRYIPADVSDTWDFNGDTSAYNMVLQRGRAVERQAALEVYPLSGDALHTEFGLRLACSDWTRPRMTLTDSIYGTFDPWSGLQKPSFNVYFRSEFGTRPLTYPLIADNPASAYEDVRLRAGKNDMVDPFITDEFMRRVFLATGQQSSRGTFAALYINGAYKGYYNVCERIRDQFMRQHHGGNADWDVRMVGDVESGDAIEWGRMLAFIQSSDFSDLATYTRVHDYLDVDNIIDYLLVNTFAATWDWPLNNWGAARERTPQGRWRLYMWDAEGAFGIYGRRTPALHDSFLGDADGDGIPETANQNYPLEIGAEARTTTWQCVPALYTLLRASPEFRLRWADRAQKHFFHQGALTRETMMPLWNTLRDAVQPIIMEQTGQTISTRIPDQWLNTSVRRDALFAQMRRYGLWVDTRAPEFSQHGGQVVAGAAIAITNPNATGTIYYTTNGVDPRAPGGAPAGTAYVAAPIVVRPCVLKARVLATNGEWSPLQEVAFTTEDRARLLVTELMYNPTGGDGYEFIELKNVGSGPAILDGAAFVEGITYTFPADTTLAPGAHFVVARTPASFSTRYPGVFVPNPGYTGKLANEGERVTLRATDGRTLVSVAYGSTAPWPATPAGQGYSLVPLDPDDNPAPDEPTNWRASTLVYGSPGTDDPPPTAPAFTATPASWVAGDGQSSSISVEARGVPAPALQWQVSRDDGGTWSDVVDSGIYTGAASSTLVLARTTADLSGARFRCIASNGVGPAVISPAATLTVVAPSRLSNFSARAQVLPGDGLVIAGLVVRGDSPARMLIRAVGPRLHDLGVNAPLADPILDIFRQEDAGAVHIASNDDWIQSSDVNELLAAFQGVGAFPLGDNDTTSAALLLDLPPGVYTAQTHGPAGQAATGVSLVEVYDLSPTRNTLANLSARGLVGRDEQVMIPGFVVQGEAPQTYLIRAVGPGLARFNVPNLLRDPRFRIVRNDHAEMAANDDWGVGGNASSVAASSLAVGAFPLDPGSTDAALLVSLAPGIYTVVVSGANDEEGLALVEVYAVP